MDSDKDPGFLLEPLADRRQALTFGFGSSGLRPQGAQLAGFGGGFFPCRCARRSLVSVIHCCSALVYSSPFAIAPIVCARFRHNSTDFDNATGRSTFFDVFQPQRRQQTWVVEHKGLSDELFGVGSYWVHAKSLGCVRQLSKSSAVRPTLCICLRKCFGGRRDRGDAGKLRPKMPPPFSFKVRGQSCQDERSG